MHYSSEYVYRFLIEPRGLTGDILPEIARSIIFGTLFLYGYILKKNY